MVNMKQLLGKVIPATTLVLAIMFALILTPGLALASTTGTSSLEGSSDIEFTPGGKNPGTTNGLELWGVPNFAFGQGAISASPKTYESKSAGSDDRYIKVLDASGTGAGWSLRGTLSLFALVSNSSTTLQGLTLEILSDGQGITQRDENGAPYGTNAKPRLLTKTLVSGGSADKIMEASTNEGMGLFYAEVKAKLNVPGGSAKKGSFKATIKWELISGVTG